MKGASKGFPAGATACITKRMTEVHPHRTFLDKVKSELGESGAIDVCILVNGRSFLQPKTHFHKFRMRRLKGEIPFPKSGSYMAAQQAQMTGNESPPHTHTVRVCV